jgi:hypothetical protein
MPFVAWYPGMIGRVGKPRSGGGGSPGVSFEDHCLCIPMGAAREVVNREREGCPLAFACLRRRERRSHVMRYRPRPHSKPDSIQQPHVLGSQIERQPGLAAGNRHDPVVTAPNNCMEGSFAADARMRSKRRGEHFRAEEAKVLTLIPFA